MKRKIMPEVKTLEELKDKDKTFVDRAVVQCVKLVQPLELNRKWEKKRPQVVRKVGVVLEQCCDYHLPTVKMNSELNKITKQCWDDWGQDIGVIKGMGLDA